MMDSGSNFGKVLADDDEAKELAMRVEPKDNEQKPSTPRSKHSATEQRRRSKINDRFQILRDLIPHSDQKRDKASFLLEVIEYIQFLQEKVHKYESDFPAWNQDATNMMPWQRNPQLPVDSAPSEPANVDSTIPGKAPPFTASMQQTGIDSGFAQQQQRLLSEPENMVYPLPSQCLRSDLSGGQALDRDLAIDEGTISVSSAYSRQIMDALTQSLQKSGVDLSEASISVQINLGRRSLNKSASVAAEHQGTWDNQATIGHSRSGSSEDESGRATKRQKQGTSR